MLYSTKVEISVLTAKGSENPEQHEQEQNGEQRSGCSKLWFCGLEALIYVSCEFWLAILSISEHGMQLKIITQMANIEDNKRIC